MTIKQLSFRSLPQISVANNSTQPELSVEDKGALIFSTLENKVLVWDGAKWNAQGKVDSVASKTGDVSLVKADVGLGNVDNTADSAKPVSTAQQTALNLKANLASPTFTGTVSGITAAMVGLSNVDNTADSAKPVSTAQATAIATAKSEAATDATTKANAAQSASTPAAHVGSTGAAHGVATASVAGFMSNSDKSKLDGIASGSNNYVHPADHPASIITQDANNRFVSDTEKAAWNAKQAAGNYATLDGTGKVPANQLPSFVDDVLEAANLAGFPAAGETAKIYVALDTNKTYRWSGSAYIAITSGAVDSVAGKTGVVTLSKADVGLDNVDNTADSAKPVSTAQQTALNLKANAASPAFTGTVTGITAAMVGLGNVDNTSDAAKPVSTAQATAIATAKSEAATDATAKANASQSNAIAASTPATHVGSTGAAHGVATTSIAGFMAAADKSKLDGIASGSNNYSHPANHPASIIAQDANNRFVSDTEKALWNNAGADATAKANAAQSNAIAASAPVAHVGSIGTSHGVATASVAGFMSNSDKAKLDGIASGATNYIHPANHPASIITQDANNRFVSDTEKALWNNAGADATAKANAAQSNAIAASTPAAHIGSTGAAHGVATASVAGFMSSADKTKIDGIASGSNNYIHPADHPASIITQDANNRFVTDAEKATWNAKQNAGTLTKADVGLGNVDNTADSAKAVLSASKLTTARTINGVAFDGTANITVADGTKVTANAAITASTGTKITYDAKGLVTSSTTLAASDIPALDAAKITSGVIDAARLPPSGFSGTYASDATFNGVTIGRGGGNISSNIAIGSALAFNQTGTNNTAVGLFAATGDAASSLTISSSHNTAFGFSALMNIVSGNQNVAIGSEALKENNTGSWNVAVGRTALFKNVSSSNNVAVGMESMYSNNGGVENTAVGTSSLRGNVTGSSNAAFGRNALNLNISGVGNVAVGASALSGSTSGGYNVAIGHGAMNALATGGGNIAIGSNTAAGALAPAFNHLSGASHIISMGHTSVTAAHVKVAWTVVSDARDKTNFAPIPHGLSFVNNLKPTAYQFRESRESEATNGGVRYGFKAQDIAAIEPEGIVVDVSDKDMLRYNESNLIPILVKAIQELTQRIIQLENK